MFMNDATSWESDYAASVQIFSALASTLRVALVHCLCERPHTVGELNECLGVSQPLVSHHLKILNNASVVSKRQEGRKTFYFIDDEHIRHTVMDVYKHAKETPS